MKARVRYFGMLAEITSKNEEILDIDGSQVSDVLEVLFLKYPTLEQKQFQVAVDHNLVTASATITEASEIALLPPFAGG